ncbi:hypothetical protein [Pendulispora albinea]|uniref:Polysaccharide lyase-like protein n=1 Tax=Pendulispora albinea TaxID=2741071 RepID=A0ABZ2M431_9BACT
MKYTDQKSTKPMRSIRKSRLRFAAGVSIVSTALGLAACNALLDNDGAHVATRDAGEGSYCQQQKSPATFCRDFDDGRSLTADFIVRTDRETVVQVDSKRSTSTPMSLVVEIPANLPEETSAYLTRRLEGPTPSEIRVSFDIILEAASDMGDPEKPAAKVFDVVAISPSMESRRSMGLMLGPDHAAIQERVPDAGNDANAYQSKPFPTGHVRPGQWARIALHVQWHTQTFRVFVNDVELFGNPLAAAWASSEEGIELRFGMSYRPKKKTAFTWRYRYDNVTWTVVP